MTYASGERPEVGDVVRWDDITHAREAAHRLKQIANGEPAQGVYGSENAIYTIERRRDDRATVLEWAIHELTKGGQHDLK